MSAANSLASAGRWFLNSGIQEPSGGFARFYNAQTGRNRAVSTEISGYAASTLVWLFRTTGDEEYLARARQTAAFLTEAWDERLRTFPFEYPSPSPESEHLAYFFDCGIIVRGLLAVWRETSDERLLEIACRAAHGMLANFRSADDYHPILALPSGTPLPRSDQWSRAPGCYQLKSALAWWEVAEITGDGVLREAYLEFADSALKLHSNFLPEAACRHGVMDRLHAYCYFLEGLLPRSERPECRKAFLECTASISKWVRDLKSEFIRSDVYAQLLRIRIYGAAFLPVDRDAAADEAEALASFQAVSEDRRTDGGFWFGRRAGAMLPHVNPVSTAFAIQALDLWRRFQAEDAPPCAHVLI